MTQASTTGRPQRGWDRIVAQLNGASDPPSFHRGMLDLQCKIVAAEYGALWVRDRAGELRSIERWPQQLTRMADDAPVMKVLKEAAESGFERGASHVLKAEPEDAAPGEHLGAHVFVTALRLDDQLVGVTTVVAECRDAAVLQQTAPLRELAAGLYQGFAARQQAQAYERESQRVRQAMGLLGVSQEAEGFRGATLNLVNEMSRELNCSRVSIGWVRGKLVKVVAMSDTENIKRHSEQVAQLEMAMAECYDQQQPVVCPVPGNAEPLLAHAVVHSHRRLLSGQPNRHVLSLPLRHLDEIVGVMVIERVDRPFDAEEVEHLQLIVDAIAPHLHDRKHSSRNILVHAWHDTEKAASYLVGPKHTAWKMLGLAIIGVLLFAILGSWPYKVSAPFEFEAREKRILPSPFEGQLAAVFVRPGEPVTAGQPLAKLDTSQLELQRLEARYQWHQAQFQREQAIQEEKASEALRAAAAMDEIEARIALLDDMIARATIVAPADGMVLDGSWHDKIGGVVEQGKPMFEVAPMADLVAVLRVPEQDIDLIDEVLAEHPLTGKLATKSEPETRFNFVHERIVPMAQAKEGVNAFEVRVSLAGGEWSPEREYARGDSVLHDNARWIALADVPANAAAPGGDSDLWKPANWLRPGMAGMAKVDVGRRPILWVLTHRIADKLELWLWM